MTKIQKFFIIFLAANFIMWSLVPLWRQSLPMDTQEALVWGKYCLWGTTKHPPFSGWLAYGFYVLTGKIDKLVYLLSTICVVLSITAIYKLACCFLNKSQAVLAAILQFGIIYYGYSAVEFNVNVISIALWPLCTLYFWRAYQNNKLSDWLLFAGVAAVNILNKYVGATLLLSLVVFVIADKSVLKLMKNIKVYAGGFLFLLILIPHFYWLYVTDFEMLNYIASRNHQGSIVSVLSHIVYPLKFLFAQILFSAASWLTYSIFYLRSEKDKFKGEKRKSLFIAATSLVPILFFMLISLIKGTPLKSMWGFPCLYMWGIALFYFFPIVWNAKKEKCLFLTMGIFSILFAAAYVMQCLLTTSLRYQTNCIEVSDNLADKWQKKMQHPLEYVGGGVWYSDMVALYAKGDVKPMIWLSPKNNPWLDTADFEIKGALVVAESFDEYQSYKRQYPHKITSPQTIKLALKNYFGKTKVKEIFYGFYVPKEAENGK